VKLVDIAGTKEGICGW